MRLLLLLWALGFMSCCCIPGLQTRIPPMFSSNVSVVLFLCTDVVNLLEFISVWASWWGLGFWFFFFLFFFFFARMLVVSWLGSGSVGCVRSYFCFLVTALCWLSRNTLDAFLSSSPSGRLSQQHSPVFVKTLKALTSGTIWAWYFCRRLALKKKKNHLKLFSMGLWV